MVSRLVGCDPIEARPKGWKKALERRLLDLWSRDGFIRIGHELKYVQRDTTRIVIVEINRHDEISITLGVNIHAVNIKKSTRSHNDCHITGLVGCRDDFWHVELKDLPVEHSLADAQSEKNFAERIYADCITPFFLFFFDSASCERMVRANRNRELQILVTKDYREFLGLPRPRMRSFGEEAQV